MFRQSPCREPRQHHANAPRTARPWQVSDHTTTMAGSGKLFEACIVIFVQPNRPTLRLHQASCAGAACRLARERRMG